MGSDPNSLSKDNLGSPAHEIQEKPEISCSGSAQNLELGVFVQHQRGKVLLATSVELHPLLLLISQPKGSELLLLF